MIATCDFVSGADLPGEWTGEPDAVDYTPSIGGCGQALVVATLVLIGKADGALDHLDSCPPCRVALAAVSDIERSAAALAFFEGRNNETPHAAGLAIAAA